MTSSIAEIGRQIAQSGAIAAQAVDEAAGATGTAATQVLASAGGLAEQAQRLRGEVDQFLANIRAA